MSKLNRLTACLMIVLMLLSLAATAFAANEQENVISGQWSPGEVTSDPIPPFEGYRVAPDGTKEELASSPFTADNIIDTKKVKEGKAKGDIGTSDWTSWPYSYQYISGSYTQNSSSYDAYHYQIGMTQAYNGTPNNATLQYKHAQTTTTSWGVTNQISVTAGLTSNWFSALNGTYSGTYAKSVTRQSSSEVLHSITIPPYKTGAIKCFIPGGYSKGTACYKEYVYSMGFWWPTGYSVHTTESGWAPRNSTITFRSGVW